MTVEAGSFYQLLVCPALSDAAFLEDYYFICVADGGEPVRYDQAGAVGHQLGQGVLHQTLALGVER